MDVTQRDGVSPIRTIGRGPVMPIGGNEDHMGDGRDEILLRFVERAGGDQARIAIVPAASSTPDVSGARYVKAFRDLGAGHADWLRIRRREHANGDAALGLLSDASGIFVTGGGQGRLVTLLIGTRAMECIRQRNADGVIVAGTSAGASILPTHVMSGGSGVGGNSANASARKGLAELSAGFGLVQDIIVDQHFSERGRMGRLLAAFAANPGLIGLGLDENTAAFIDGDGVLEVLGSEMATIIDGRNTVSDYGSRKPGEILTITDSSLHVLGAGRKFDLTTRQLTAAPEEVFA